MQPDASLTMAVQLLVPLKLMQLQQAGGPTADDWQWLTSGKLAHQLATMGEKVVVGVQEGDPLLSEMVRSIALMAYLPGGIHIFGQHFMIGEQHEPSR